MSTTEILDTDTKTAIGDQPRQSSAPERVIPVRRISFEESLRELPKLFAGGDLIAGHLIAALSAVFPDGEDFFVRSVGTIEARSSTQFSPSRCAASLAKRQSTAESIESSTSVSPSWATPLAGVQRLLGKDCRGSRTPRKILRSLRHLSTSRQRWPRS